MDYNESINEPGEEPNQSQIESLTRAFHEQLQACLEECAAGRWGLFTDLEHVSEEVAKYRAWSEAARLRELAFALQSILAQSGEADLLCDQFLDLCSIHGENDPGEPKLARAFLNEIAGGQ